MLEWQKSYLVIESYLREDSLASRFMFTVDTTILRLADQGQWIIDGDLPALREASLANLLVLTVVTAACSAWLTNVAGVWAEFKSHKKAVTSNNNINLHGVVIMSWKYFDEFFMIALKYFWRGEFFGISSIRLIIDKTYCYLKYTERKKKRIIWLSKRRIYYKNKFCLDTSNIIPTDTDN